MTIFSPVFRFCIPIICLFASASLHAQMLKQDMDQSRPPNPDGGLYERMRNSPTLTQNNHRLGVFTIRAEMIDEIARANETEGIVSDAKFEALENYALSLRIELDLEEAEDVFKELLDLRRIRFDEADRNVLITLNDYAMIVDDLGREREAEQLYLELLGLTRVAHGADHPDISVALTNYASFLYGAGRHSEALELQAEAVRINNATLNEGSRAALPALNNYGVLLLEMGQTDQAAQVLAEAFALSRRALRSIHMLEDRVALMVAANYVEILLELGREAEAVSFFEKEVISHFEVWNGLPSIPFESQTAIRSIVLYAQGLAAIGRTGEADELLLHSLSTAANRLGTEHPQTLALQRDYAEFQLDSADPRLAHSKTQRLTRFARERAVGLGNEGIRGTSQRNRERKGNQELERFHADTTWAAYQAYLNEIEEIPTLSEEEKEQGIGRLSSEFSLEALDALIRATANSTSRAVGEAAALKFASQRGLADLANERQVLVTDWTVLEAAMVREQARSQPSQKRIEAARSRLSEIEFRLTEIDRRMGQEAPQYLAILNQDLLNVFGVIVGQPDPKRRSRGEIQNRQVLSGETAACADAFSERFGPETQRFEELRLCLVRSVLSDDEALVFLVPTDRGTHSLAFSIDAISWSRSAMDREALVGAIEEFRLGLEVQAGDAFLPVFDLELAHELYSELIAPVEEVLEGKSLVYVVADGALSRLPLGTLLASPVSEDMVGDDPDTLRRADWLADRYALAQLPSLQSLVYIRTFGIDQEQGDANTFAGFGAPELDGNARLRGARSATLDAVDAASLVSELRGAADTPLMNPDALRKLAELPGTKSELEQVRKALGAPHTSMYLAGRMTEFAIRNADLSDIQVLHLATHGFTSEESGETAEPGLVFTPPSQASSADDGYLAASEIIGLNLTRAQWVILSACNTASPSGKSGETGLSGLAQAFFYAGAEGLLVSHWPVFDDIAPLLTVEALKRSEADQTRAEALQAAMREIRMNPELDAAHPAVWAPFTLVGEGR